MKFESSRDAKKVSLINLICLQQSPIFRIQIKQS